VHLPQHPTHTSHADILQGPFETPQDVTRAMTRTLTPAKDEYLRLHAKAMVPSTREIHIPEAMTAYADSTLLTMLQAAMKSENFKQNRPFAVLFNSNIRAILPGMGLPLWDTEASLQPDHTGPENTTFNLPYPDFPCMMTGRQIIVFG